MPASEGSEIESQFTPANHSDINYGNEAKDKSKAAASKKKSVSKVKQDLSLESSAEQKKLSNCLDADFPSLKQGEIFIDNDVEVSITMQNAVTSALENMNDSSSEDVNNPYEAIFVPLEANDAANFLSNSEKMGDVDETTNLSYDSSANVSGDKSRNCPDGKSNSMSLFSDNNSTTEEPKVVVQMAPSADISLSNISALINNDSENDISDEDETQLVGSNDGINCGEINFHSSTSKQQRQDNQELQEMFRKPDSGTCVESLAVDSFIRSNTPTKELDQEVNILKIRRRFHCPPTSCCNHSQENKQHTSSGCTVSNGNFLDVAIKQEPLDNINTENGEQSLPEGSEFNLRKSDHCLNEKKKKCAKKKASQDLGKSEKKCKLELDFEIMSGNGTRLRDIECISAEIEDASPDMLAHLHSVMFDVAGSSKSKQASGLTKRNIMNFSGFPFKEDSDAYARVDIRLQRLHSKILNDIAQILFGTCVMRRMELEERVMSFLLLPTAEKAEEMRCKRSEKRKLEDDDDHVNDLADAKRQQLDCEGEKDTVPQKNEDKEKPEGNEEDWVDKKLKEFLQSGKAPVAKVALRRLTEEEMRKYQKTSNSHVCSSEDVSDYETASKSQHSNKRERKRNAASKNHEYPWYLRNMLQESSHRSSPGCSMTSFDQNSADAELLATHKGVHSPVKSTTRSKVSHVMKGGGKPLKSIHGVARRIHAAECMTISLLHGMLFGVAQKLEECRNNLLEFSGFTTQCISLNECRMFMERLDLHELQDICNIFNQRCIVENSADCIKRLLSFFKAPSEHAELLSWCSSSSALPKESVADGKPLRSFENVRSAIECAIPEDLIGLHDLLYVNSCDSFEIHKRILDFSGFSFNINSSEYHYRKTLMCYMSDSDVREIARLLNLLHIYPHINKDELSSCILKFLLEIKVLKNDSCSGELSGSYSKPNIVKLRKNGDDAVPKDTSCNLTPPVDTSFATSCNLTPLVDTSFALTPYNPPAIHDAETQTENSGNSALELRLSNFASERNTSLHTEESKPSDSVRNTSPSFHITEHSQCDDVVGTSSHYRLMDVSSPNIRIEMPETPCLERSLHASESNPGTRTISHTNPQAVVPSYCDSSSQQKSNIAFMNDDDMSSSDEESYAISNFPLAAFANHPSDRQLKKDVKLFIQRGYYNMTISELVKAVISNYPQLNLSYKRKFIKMQAFNLLSRVKVENHFPPEVPVVEMSRNCQSISSMRSDSNSAVINSESGPGMSS